MNTCWYVRPARLHTSRSFATAPPRGAAAAEAGLRAEGFFPFDDDGRLTCGGEVVFFFRGFRSESSESESSESSESSDPSSDPSSSSSSSSSSSTTKEGLGSFLGRLFAADGPPPRSFFSSGGALRDGARFSLEDATAAPPSGGGPRFLSSGFFVRASSSSSGLARTRSTYFATAALRSGSSSARSARPRSRSSVRRACFIDNVSTLARKKSRRFSTAARTSATVAMSRSAGGERASESAREARGAGGETRATRGAFEVTSGIEATDDFSNPRDR